MRKLYFIASIPKVAKDNTITGVVANGSGRQATAEEVSSITTLLREKGCRCSLLDSLRDGNYPNPVAVFDRRADARKEAALLNSYPGSFFNWHVLEVGESIRKPVRKPLGWRIKYDQGETSCFNSEEDGATVLIDPNHSQLRSDNRLFPTREDARTAMRKADLTPRTKSIPDGYYIEPYYA